MNGGIARLRDENERLRSEKVVLAEAIAILRECEEKWGCECPYCDRNFGEDFDSHDDDCRIKRFLDAEGKARAALEGKEEQT